MRVPRKIVQHARLQVLRTQRRMKFNFPVRKQHDLDAALLLFVDLGSLHLDCAAVRSRVLHRDGTTAPRLDAVMNGPVRRYRVRSKTGAGIIHLQ